MGVKTKSILLFLLPGDTVVKWYNRMRSGELMKKEGKQGTVMDLTVWDFSNKLSCVFLPSAGKLEIPPCC